jgi:hypothetical protein
MGRRLHVLESIGEEIWLVEGPTVSFFGFPYPTRMAIVRLSESRLWVWSPVALAGDLHSEVEKLGTPRYLVAPNKLHHLYLGEWQKVWPEARLYGAPGLARRRRDLRFDAELGDEPPAEWRDEIDQTIFRGTFAMQEAVFFHRRSSTALVCDLVQRFDPAFLPPLRRFVMIADGLVGPRGSTPREWRATFWNRRAAGRALARALAWQPKQLVIAHGEWARDHGADVLRTGLRWLKPVADR